MKRFVLTISVMFVLFSVLFAQDRSHKRTHWINMGEHETGVVMYLSFNFFEVDLYIEPPDSTTEGEKMKYTTRCRYKLSNPNDYTIEVYEVTIRVSGKAKVYDAFHSTELITIEPWKDYYGAFLTPGLRKAGTSDYNVYMSIRARKKED